MFNFVKKYQILLFFTLTTILGYAPLLFTGKPIWFIYGMPISGILLTLYLHGWPTVLSQLKAAINIKAPLLEYFKILFLLISMNILTLLCAYIFFGDTPSFQMIKTEPLLIPVLLGAILLGGPILEEVFGLRGYVLPKLLRTKSPLLSSILIGIYFGAWHFVEFIRPGSSQYAIGLKFYPLFILSEISLSVLMTYFYIRNNHNLFLAGIFFHWMMNSTAVLFQTDITLTEMAYAPKMNEHYFIIYSIILCIVATFVVVKSKLYHKQFEH